MGVFQNLQPASFDGIKFAVRAVRVRGGQRDHVFKFPHQAGGVEELLGRELYTFEMDAMFSTEMFREYPNAWPGDLSDLRDRFEQGTRSTLVVPSIGNVQAYCTNWDQSWNVMNQTGESATFTFREVFDTELLQSNVVQVNYQSIGAKYATVNTLAEAADLQDAFSAIKGYVTSISALGDKAELIGSLYLSKVQGLASECEALIERVDAMSKPKNHKLLYAVIDLGVSALRLHEDLLSKFRPTFLYSVPTDMSMLSIATAMYGSTELVMELLLMNAVNDFDLVPAGTEIRGYKKAS